MTFEERLKKLQETVEAQPELLAASSWPACCHVFPEDKPRRSFVTIQAGPWIHRAEETNLRKRSGGMVNQFEDGKDGLDYELEAELSMEVYGLVAGARRIIGAGSWDFDDGTDVKSSRYWEPWLKVNRARYARKEPKPTRFVLVYVELPKKRGTLIVTVKTATVEAAEDHDYGHGDAASNFTLDGLRLRAMLPDSVCIICGHKRPAQSALIGGAEFDGTGTATRFDF